MSKYVTLTGYCSTTKKPIGIQFSKVGSHYVAVGSYIVSSASGTGKSEELTGKVYASGFKCKRCDNTCVIVCSCNTVICIKSNAPEVTCPKCGKNTIIEWVEDINKLSDSKLNGNKQ